jgi:hypothetical protein
MPAHSLRINDEIARRSEATHRTRFFGGEFASDMPGSVAANILRDGRTHRADAAFGKATHTDPQILFSAAP